MEQNAGASKPASTQLAKQGPMVILAGFLVGGLFRLAEFVFVRGVTVRARLTRDSNDKKSFEVDVRLNAFDDDGTVRQQDNHRDYWRR